MPEPSSPLSTAETDNSSSAAGSTPKRRSWLKVLFAIAGLTLFAVVAIAGFLVFRPTAFNLSRYSEAIDRQMTAALGREISIDGDVILMTGMVPAIRIEKVSVDNPGDWKSGGKFASLDRLETSVGLRELLDRKIHIDDIAVSGLEVSLERDASGQGNWVGFAAIGEGDTGQGEEVEPGEGFDLEFTELGGIVIEDLHVSYRDPETLEAQEFALDRLEGSAKAGQPLLLSISGTYLRLPLNAEFKGGSLTGLRSRAEEWPVEIEATLGDTMIDLAGNLSTVDFEVPGLLNFDLDIPKPGQLVPLVGDLPDFGSLRLSGQAQRSAADDFSVSDLSGRLGSAEMTGNLSLNLSGSIPRIGGDLKIGSINVDEFRRDSEDGDDEKTAGRAVPIEENMLPFAGQLRLEVGELAGAVPGMEVRDLNTTLELGGNTISAGLEVMFAEVPLHGELSVNRPAKGEFGFGISLSSPGSDFSDIVSYYSGTDRFQGSFEKLNYHIDGAGKDLSEAWLARTVRIEVTQANMVYQGVDEDHHFTLERGNFDRSSGETADCHLIGSFSGAPFDLKLVFDAADPTRPALSRIKQLDGTIADVEVSLSNQLQERPEFGDGQLAFKIKGTRLDRLDAIYELNLPPLGPYSASGVFLREGKLMEFNDVALQVGSSRLTGHYRLDKRQGRAQVSMELKSRSLQLDDFTFDKWSPINAGSSGTEPASTAGAGSMTSSINDVLSYEALNRGDATLKLDVDELLSGKDKLGHANLTATLKNGSLVVSPLTLGIPGGSFKGEFKFHPKADRTVDWRVKLGADGFELGVLARRADPDSDFSAVANIQLDVFANGTPYDVPNLKTASGSFDFDVCPRNVTAGSLDIWATNLIVALLPRLDPENESTVNCVIGRFRLEDGIMLATDLGMDTTTLRIVAEGQIDLVAGKYDLALTPNPKRPQLLSLEMPLGVHGPLNAPEISMGKLPAVRTVGRMARNTLLFPLRVIAGERLPRDGSDICPCETVSSESGR